MAARCLVSGCILALCLTAVAPPAMAQAGSDIADFIAMEKEAAPPRAVRPRILGGIPVSAQTNREFQVGLARTAELSDDPESQFNAQFCGGSLIAPRFVLTAAHCIISEDEDGNASMRTAADITILYGNTDLKLAKRVAVSQIVMHPAFDQGTLESDITLLELAEALDLPVIKLADHAFEADHARPGTTAIVSGWGKLDDGTFPYQLMETDLTIQDANTCANGLIALYSKQFQEVVHSAAGRLAISDDVARQAFDTIVSAAGNPLPTTIVCAGTPTGVRDSCSGDSGGPLFVTYPNEPVQVGIVSSGEVPLSADGPCGHEQLYGYYTRVSDFRDWIDGHVSR